VNSYVLVQLQVPFGGYKSSGWGRELGMEGLNGYLETKVRLPLVVFVFDLHLPSLYTIIMEASLKNGPSSFN
jgi:hypothetical protein